MVPFLQILAAVILSAETSHPSNSFYTVGSTVEVEFSLSGLKPNEKRLFEAGIFDELDREIGRITSEVEVDSSGKWSQSFVMPSKRLGFYRVRAKSGDTLLAKVGTRPIGTLTYAVVVDPAKRPFIPCEDAFFGIFGNPQAMADLRPWLGTHQNIGGGVPAKNDAEFASESPARESFAEYGPILASRLARDLAPYIEDEKDRKALSRHTWPWNLIDEPEGERLYREGLTALVKASRKRPWPHAGKKRIYEIFWEPDLTFKNPEHLVKVAKIAYETIHAADPDALVAAPTFAGVGTGLLLKRCLDAGLAEAMDVFSIHPYTTYPPEKNKTAEKLRAMMAMIKEAKGRELPMIATESGGCYTGSVKDEILQMDGQLTCHLTTLGEGFLFHNLFHGYDYGRDANVDCDGDYGISYNLLYPKRRWQPDKVSPRPAASAISAASYLVDGKRPTCRIEWLGDTVRGYAYSDRTENCVIALWDWSGEDATVQIPVGRSSVELADVMGNIRKVETHQGSLTLKLSTSPQYILKVDPEIWGFEAQKRLGWSKRKYKNPCPKEQVVLHNISPALVEGKFALKVDLENISDAPIEGDVEFLIGSHCAAKSKVRLASEERSTFSAIADVGVAAFKATIVEVSFVSKSKRIVTKKAAVNFLVSKRLPESCDILQASSLLKRKKINLPATRRPQQWSGEKDLSAEAAFGWNSKFLFVDILVRDDEFVQKKTLWSIWNGDAIQLALARVALETESGNLYADLVEEACSETNYALTHKGSEAYRTVTWDWKGMPTGTHGEGAIKKADAPYEVEVNTLPSGAVEIHYRLAFPWHWLRVKNPTLGDNIRFAISVNDMDNGEKIVSAIEAFNLKKVLDYGFLLLGNENVN